MQNDEEEILELLRERMAKGRKQYGPWKVSDGRDYRKEAFEEILDALHYCAAELLKIRRAERGNGPV